MVVKNRADTLVCTSPTRLRSLAPWRLTSRRDLGGGHRLRTETDRVGPCRRSTNTRKGVDRPKCREGPRGLVESGSLQTMHINLSATSRVLDAGHVRYRCFQSFRK